MIVSPEVLRIVHQWVEKAEDDLINAKYVLTLKEQCPVGTVCYHAQQCVEKYLKALLTLHGVPFHKTHDLPELFMLIPKNSGLQARLDDLGVINRYSVEGRYPGDWDPITRNEAETAVSVAEKFKTAAKKIIPTLSGG